MREAAATPIHPLHTCFSRNGADDEPNAKTCTTVSLSRLQRARRLETSSTNLIAGRRTELWAAMRFRRPLAPSPRSPALLLYPPALPLALPHFSPPPRALNSYFPPPQALLLLLAPASEAPTKR